MAFGIDAMGLRLAWRELVGEFVSSASSPTAHVEISRTSTHLWLISRRLNVVGARR